VPLPLDFQIKPLVGLAGAVDVLQRWRRPQHRVLPGRLVGQKALQQHDRPVRLRQLLVVVRLLSEMLQTHDCGRMKSSAPPV
jgi:hypothetical protein